MPNPYQQQAANPMAQQAAQLRPTQMQGQVIGNMAQQAAMPNNNFAQPIQRNAQGIPQGVMNRFPGLQMGQQAARPPMGQLQQNPQMQQQMTQNQRGQLAPQLQGQPMRGEFPPVQRVYQRPQLI